MQSTAERSPSWWQTWGQLLRLPNLFTVPGEAAAGFVLASGGVIGPDLWAGCAIVLLIYAGGLLLNDYCDREEDARERADRPIPSGAVKPGTVLGAGTAAMVAALLLALVAGGLPTLAPAAAVAGLAVAYDAGLRKVPIAGPLAMGLCRGGSILIGASLVSGPPTSIVQLAAATAACYTIAITVVAANETSGKSPGWRAWLPALVIAVALGIAASWGIMTLPAWLWLGLAIVEAGSVALLVTAGKLPVPACVGRFIRTMVDLQAGWFCLALPSAAAVVVFGLVRIGAGLAGRRFYGS